MARINIDDDFWDAVTDVAARCQNATEAAGMALRFIRFAQQKHLKEEPLVWSDIENKFELLNGYFFSVSLETGDIKVIGPAAQFGWLNVKSEAGRKGGIASAQRPRDEKGRLLPKHVPSEVQAASSDSKLTKQIQASSSSSSSSSGSSSGSSNLNTGRTPASQEPPKNNLIAHYCDAWKLRYGSNPMILPKDAGQLKKFVEAIGVERSKQVITTYLSMPEKWFVTKRHDISTMIANLNAIQQFMNNGKVLTTSTSKELERQVDREQRKIENGGISAAKQIELDEQRQLKLQGGSRD